MMASRFWVVGAIGVAVLSGSSLSAGVIANPSFESKHDGLMANGVPTSLHETWGLPDGWTWRNSGATNGHDVRKDDLAGWSSDGDWSLYVFASTTGSHQPGDYIEFYQTVDLTGIDCISFDALLWGGTYTNSYVSIDSVKLWTRNEAGTYYDQTIDVSGYSGVHELALGVCVFEAFGDTADGWTHFDNLAAVPEPITLCLVGLGVLAIRRRRS